MKKELSPGVVIAIIAVVVAIALVFIWRAYNGPSAPAHAGSGVVSAPGGGSERGKAMREAMMAAHQQHKPGATNPANHGGTH